MKRDDRVNYSNTSFFGMLRINKLSTLTFKSVIFYISIIVAFVFYYFSKYLSDESIIEFAVYLANILPSVSATLLGIIIAGLAIIVALSTGNIYNQLLKDKTLQRLLFPFWYAAVLWALITSLAISLKVLLLLSTTRVIFIIIILIIFFLNYALLGTINLVGNTIRIMVYLAKIKK